MKNEEALLLPPFVSLFQNIMYKTRKRILKIHEIPSFSLDERAVKVYNPTHKMQGEFPESFKKPGKGP